MKLKALTLVEITVVMLITSVVVSLGYGGYLMMTKSYANKLAAHQISADINRFKQIMEVNIFESDSIKWNSDVNQLSFGTSKAVLFEDTLIIYRTAIDDTLFLVPQRINTVELDLKKEKVLQNMTISLDYNDEPLSLVFTKNYSDYFKEGL